MSIRVRMAPSPTGPIHVGNVHTALFNWLWARGAGGKFILRFEDTDQERSRAEWEHVIIEDLKWLGMDWDEGPDIGGPYAPYRQMARLDLYAEYCQKLLENGHAYHCYCTPEELAAERKEADAQRVAYKYSRRCLGLSAAEKAAFEAEGRKPVVRLQVPDNEVVAYNDLVLGPIEFPTHSISDPIIMRANGIPLYNFAVVIDDVTMKITHILRGEGHVSNTPVQILIYRALGFAVPEIGHIGHLTNSDRGKLSKRKGDGGVTEYREKGVLPETLFNFMALLGFTPEGDEEKLSKEEIIKAFDINRVTKASAVFDEAKLEWLNGRYLRENYDTEGFARLALPYVVQAGLMSEADAEAHWGWFVEVMEQVHERVNLLSEVASYTTFFFNEEIEVDEKAAEKFLRVAHIPEYFAAVREGLAALDEWNVEAIERVIRGLMEARGLKPREAIQPIRVAVTGVTASPGLFETVYLVGRERTLKRLAAWS